MWGGGFLWFIIHLILWGAWGNYQVSWRTRILSEMHQVLHGTLTEENVEKYLALIKRLPYIRQNEYECVRYDYLRVYISKQVSFRLKDDLKHELIRKGVPKIF